MVIIHWYLVEIGEQPHLWHTGIITHASVIMLYLLYYITLHEVWHLVMREAVQIPAMLCAHIRRPTNI